MNFLLYVDDSLIIEMVQVSLNLRCSRISWILILYFDLDPCCLLEVTLWVMVGYSLRYSKVIDEPTKDSPLLNRGRVYLWPLVGMITWESLARVEMP